ncbi:isoaspartyl peptidase/L-asparaginase [Pseudobacter ginsenosidimutans]|uniref:Isoaspartyl peptidase n=1 Tax=Pseudobacter ginsenosidimutans TaxID=661488 RepID=A0A4Q7ML35_9BACT|nr:isoaspartyl peptidase/L-asparaginase [Pseudobacter ginsenosidimutans]RZS69016.1 beta-aspartyl-peptidase (threonine type) [Pseudobacter ginsenosidimutans]
MIRTKWNKYVLQAAAGLLAACNVYAQSNPSLKITGDPADITTPTRGGVVLIGGGGNVDGAFKWMIDRSGGGDVVVIRASGDYLYNDDIAKLGKVNSVETLLINSRDVANDDKVANTIRNAEMLFITGGDQSNYMNFWRNTKTSEAINYLLNQKKVPVGGTSAGCAVLSGFYYSGETGSATADILNDPFDKNVTLYNNDFLQPPYLKNVLTDQHYTQRRRQGRHVTFLSRIINDWKVFPKGIAPDERTAVCIDDNGKAQVIGEGKAYFLITDAATAPEQVKAGESLQWKANQKAIRVYEIQGSATGAGSFSVADFDAAKAKGGTWYWWWVDKGVWQQSPADKFVIVVHGGAGTILKSKMTPEKEAAYKKGLQQALEAGYAKWKTGAPALDAVEAAVRVLEDNPLFNAGKGAVFTHDGKNELDASIMNGKTLQAGAVAGVKTLRHPISAARAVMEKSEHVMMVGAGAEQFAKEAGMEIVKPEYFRTEERWKQLQQAIKEDEQKAKLDHSYHKAGTINVDNKFGTVGCVVLDKSGFIAAGTSTGGMTNKKYGRVGDSPIIGAGTYANGTVGISCTGWGEFYIRSVVAYDLAAQMEYKGFTVQDAGKSVIAKVGKLGGDGGLIALDVNGNVAMPFNTEGMYRGTVTAEGKIAIEIYKN